MRTIITLSIEREIVNKINSLKGLVSRSRFIEQMLKEVLKNGNESPNNS